MLPNFMDVFTWSVPFVTEKILQILANMLKPPDGIADDPESEEEAKVPLVKTDPKATGKAKKYEIMKNRVFFVGKMMKMIRTLREENESIV
jgi:serine/threonine-protein phosphatase 2B catalytic subunit